MEEKYSQNIQKIVSLPTIKMFVRIIPFQRTFDMYGLIYFVPEGIEEKIKKYQIVNIPIKNSISMGIVFDIFLELPTGIAEDKIKSIIEIKNEEIFLFSYQAKLLDFIAQNCITPIHNALGVFFPRNLREKIEKQTLHKVTAKEYSYEYNSKNILTEIQQKSYREIQNSENKKVLFYGVTGSGKTEIYKEIIYKNLKDKKQSLLLIPEIILGNQIGERMKEIFGEDVLVISSDVTEAKKTQYWIDIQSGNAKIIVGTRSSIFYPYKDLATIIVDEEHDQSYVSDSAPRYSTVDLVSEISDLLNIPVIFASGTPSIRSMYKAMKGEYKLVNLLEKF